jgi:hypothetical protein
MAYNEKKLQELLNGLGGEVVDDSAAYDIADGIVFEEEGLKEFLLTKGISDPIGYIADRL